MNKWILSFIVMITNFGFGASFQVSSDVQKKLYEIKNQESSSQTQKHPLVISAGISKTQFHYFLINTQSFQVDYNPLQNFISPILRLTYSLPIPYTSITAESGYLEKSFSYSIQDYDKRDYSDRIHTQWFPTSIYISFQTPLLRKKIHTGLNVGLQHLWVHQDGLLDETHYQDSMLNMLTGAYLDVVLLDDIGLQTSYHLLSGIRKEQKYSEYGLTLWTTI